MTIQQTPAVPDAGLRRRLLPLLALLLMLALAGVTTACGGDSSDEPAADAAPDPERVVTLRDFAVELPDGWRHETLSPDQEFIGKVVDGSVVTFNVLRERLRPGVTLEEYMAPDERLEASRRVLAREGVEFSEPGDGQRATLGGIDALRYRQTGVAKGIEIETGTVVAKRDGVAYLVAFGGPREHFDDHLPEFEAIVDSWRWK